VTDSNLVLDGTDEQGRSLDAAPASLKAFCDSNGIRSRRARADRGRPNPTSAVPQGQSRKIYFYAIGPKKGRLF